MASTKKLQEVRSHWENHVQSWRKQNVSQRKYARNNCLKEKSFNYWCRKLKSTGNFSLESKFPDASANSAVKFIPLLLPEKLNCAPEKNIKSLPVFIGKRFKIIVDEGFSPKLLSEIIVVLEKIK